MPKAGDVIERWGQYRVRHYQQHRKDTLKTFKPGTYMSLPFTFPRCDKCPPGYPLYTLKSFRIR